MNKLFKNVIFSLLSVLMFIPIITFAQNEPYSGLGNLFNSSSSSTSSGDRNFFSRFAKNIDPDNTGEGIDTLKDKVGDIIKVVLDFVGIIMILFIGYGGYLWMMSGGDEEGAKKGKTYLTNAVIGLIIVIAGWLLTSFILQALRTPEVGYDFLIKFLG